MKNLQFTGKLYGKQITLKQIQKRTALKLFCKGEVIYIQSSNFNPMGIWSHAMPLELDNEELKSQKELSEVFKKNGWETTYISDTEEKQFNECCASFIYYNCSNEQGKYIHFYTVIA